uniref:Uncharacterized protein n=1 Tax=Caenorhabditis japonica TaxID=281687 RepID=A0A8R1EMA0_CAEJA
MSTPENSKHFQKFKSPLLTQKNSAPSSFTVGMDEKSKYFQKKINENGTPKTSNPFRCPAFVKSAQKKSDDVDEKTSLLGNLDVDKTVEIQANYRFVGFKSTGLRRKSTF